MIDSFMQRIAVKRKEASVVSHSLTIIPIG